MQDYGVKIQLQLNFHTNTFVIMSFVSNFSFYQRMKVFEKSCEIKGVHLPKDFDPNVNQEANEIDQLFDDLELQSTCGIGLWTN